MLAGLVGLGAVALNGNSRLRATSHDMHAVGERAAMDNATWANLMDFKGGLEGYVGADEPELRAELGDLVEQRVALLDGRLAEMHRRYPEGTDGSRLTSAQELPYLELRRIWKRWQTRPLRRGAREERVKARTLAAIRDHGILMADSGEASSRGDELVAEEAEALAARQYASTRRMLLIALAGLACALLATLVWFARRVMPGIERERAEQRHALEQARLHARLRAATDDREASTVLADHLERQVPGAGVIVLTPTLDKVALEAHVPVAPRGPLGTRLADARPRDCLAMRHGATQATAPGDRLSLLGCNVCGKLPGATTCHPLLSGDEAGGAVLVSLERPISEDEHRKLGESVDQAAPVITSLRELAEARDRAATDALTGLPNRRAFEDAARRMVAQASRTVEPLAAVMLDLDHFKSVNDSFGHGAGDDALICVGSCLTASVRAGDVVARLGGEEFALLLPGTGREGALVLAENVRRAVAMLAVPGVDRPITASLGVAVIPDDAGDADSVVRRADAALYEAKTGGRDRVIAASGGLVAPAHR